MAVMAARRFLQREDALAWPKQTTEHGDVGDRGADGLNVRVLCAEKAFGTVLRQEFDPVEDLTPADLTRSWIAGRVLVDQDRGLGLDRGAWAIALGSDQVERAILAPPLFVQQRGHLRIGIRDTGREQARPGRHGLFPTVDKPRSGAPTGARAM